MFYKAISASLFGLVSLLVAYQPQPMPAQPTAPTAHATAQQRADAKTAARQIKVGAIPLKSTATPIVEAQNVIDLRNKLAAGGEVIIEPGRYVLERPLVITRATSLKGRYRDLTTIDCRQMTDPTLPGLMIDRVWGYELSNFVVQGNRTLNAIGILNSTNTPNANGTSGTCSGSAIWSHIIVAGFKTGVVIGDGTRYVAASENLYTHLEVVQCDTCIALNDYNTLNHKFIMLQMGDCNRGMTTYGASYISVDGGSFSSCRGVLFDMVNCMAAKFQDCRMEDSGMFLRCGTSGTAGNTIVEGCLIHQSARWATDNTSVYANGWKSPIVVGGAHFLTVRNCFIACTVSDWPAIYSLSYGLVEAVGNQCTIDPSGNMFFGPNKTTFVNSLAATPNGKVYTRGNMWTDGGQVFKGWYPDQTYPLVP